MSTRAVLLIVTVFGSMSFFASFGSSSNIEPQKILQKKLLIQSITNENLIHKWNDVSHVCRFNRVGSKKLVLALGTDNSKKPEKFALIRSMGSELIFERAETPSHKAYPSVVKYQNNGLELILRFDPLKKCPGCDGAAKNGLLILVKDKQKVQQRFEGFCAI